MVSFPLQTRCAREVNPLSPIRHTVDPKLIANDQQIQENPLFPNPGFVYTVP
jgi:hypothetical protein